MIWSFETFVGCQFLYIFLTPKLILLEIERITNSILSTNWREVQGVLNPSKEHKKINYPNKGDGLKFRCNVIARPLLMVMNCGETLGSMTRKSWENMLELGSRKEKGWDGGVEEKPCLIYMKKYGLWSSLFYF